VGLHFSFRYKKGAANSVADALSHTRPLFAIHAISECAPHWVHKVIRSYDMDEEASKLRATIAPDTVRERQGRVWMGSNAGLRTKLIHALC
jgi:hypothetical protein